MHTPSTQVNWRDRQSCPCHKFKVRVFGQKVVNYVEFNTMAVLIPKGTPKLNTEILLWTMAKCDKRQSFVSIKGSVTNTSKTKKSTKQRSQEKSWFHSHWCGILLKDKGNKVHLRQNRAMNYIASAMSAAHCLHAHARTHTHTHTRVHAHNHVHTHAHAHTHAQLPFP